MKNLDGENISYYGWIWELQNGHIWLEWHITKVETWCLWLGTSTN
jgi:hypothetical protein